ncbi:Uncharacterized protein FWK35_00030492, partial [Aphis craccivora]
ITNVFGGKKKFARLQESCSDGLVLVLVLQLWYCFGLVLVSLILVLVLLDQYRLGLDLGIGIQQESCETARPRPNLIITTPKPHYHGWFYKIRFNYFWSSGRQ